MKNRLASLLVFSTLLISLSVSASEQLEDFFVGRLYFAAEKTHVYKNLYFKNSHFENRYIPAIFEDYSGNSDLILKNDELFLVFPKQKKQISLGLIDFSRPDEPGSTATFTSRELLTARVVKYKKDRDLEWGFSAIPGGSLFNVRTNHYYLVEYTTFQGERVCVNRGILKDKDYLFPGACTRK